MHGGFQISPTGKEVLGFGEARRESQLKGKHAQQRAKSVCLCVHTGVCVCTVECRGENLAAGRPFLKSLSDGAKPGVGGWG